MSKLLMVDPEHFRIEYSINPHMRDADGKLRSVDKKQARSEWEGLKKTFEKLGATVEVLPGHPDLPDMVFAANQSFVFLDPKTGARSVVLSRMRVKERQAEVPLFAEWYLSHGFNTIDLPATVGCFEGTGDALLHASGEFIWGGYGFRTSSDVYPWLAEVTGKPVVPLELTDPSFYHLDTCFVVLDKNTVAVVDEAFSRKSLERIFAKVPRVLEIDVDEAAELFAANAFAVDAKNVVLHEGCEEFRETLENEGFKVHEVPTGEFLKAGGSVFCLKMSLV